MDANLSFCFFLYLFKLDVGFIGFSGFSFDFGMVLLNFDFLGILAPFFLDYTIFGVHFCHISLGFGSILCAFMRLPECLTMFRCFPFMFLYVAFILSYPLFSPDFDVFGPVARSCEVVFDMVPLFFSVLCGFHSSVRLVLGSCDFLRLLEIWSYFMCTVCFTSVMFALNFATSPGVWVHFPTFLLGFVFASEIFDYLIRFFAKCSCDFSIFDWWSHISREVAYVFSDFVALCSFHFAMQVCITFNWIWLAVWCFGWEFILFPLRFCWTSAVSASQIFCFWFLKLS